MLCKKKGEVEVCSFLNRYLLGIILLQSACFQSKREIDASRMIKSMQLIDKSIFVPDNVDSFPTQPSREVLVF